jgi:Ryanodine Receptor TM 4-6
MQHHFGKTEMSLAVLCCFQSMLARNFYKFKLLALALAFSINVMLLFFKVSNWYIDLRVWLLLSATITELSLAFCNHAQQLL